ncbi:ribosomal protein S18-alanine N-acetyltransferase [Mesobacillus maritimus]|uniref:ribosomal protein S18-alanine N-acetyltransferase n=1 Tax=Mesobacillus maritimus TaxID=1643336 RepID=UPI0020406A21|nr:ribosomal protein S18-alanine N-acetyltransferase [Mesobacillus maritimus]MCM3588679.1 ribosomal protein S18-alanine N-acetyltransferase [Mesobacillus maritimus]MCM3671940.1 ribosomal protein S18-alanine N-acetyltransferase [Mesobacillus maritimus]
MNKTIAFRRMETEDIDRIYEIETKSFTTPWSREAFYNELTKNRFALYTVIEVDDQVVGYCGAWFIVDEVHITNIALLPEYRGMKLGEALLVKVMDMVREMGAKTMTLEVRVSNNRAQSLYRKLGFKDGAIRKNYYTDDMEDALVMWVNL